MTRRILCRVFLVIVGLAILAPWRGRVRGDPQVTSSWITKEEQTGLVERLRTALPPGWTVTSGALGGVPDEWRSIDTRSFEVDGKNGDDAFRIWFVSTDWIGIRQPGSKRARMVYWEGVLADPRYKAITPDGPFPVYEDLHTIPVYVALHAMGMHPPSLINSGWTSGMALFGDRLSDVDQQTQNLVRRFCSTQACVDETARSLIVLGVPARILTRDCAEHAIGNAQVFCTDALGYWKAPEDVRVLNAVVSNPSTSLAVRRSAAFSLGRIADLSSGPALREALQAVPPGDRETAIAIADAIGRLRYGPAAPNVLVRLEGERDRPTQLWYARVLAALQYAPAVPAIEKLCETTTVSADWIESRSRTGDPGSLPELALLRITGLWGRPVRGIRLLLLAPENPMMSRRIPIASLIENVGETDVEMFRNTPGLWIVDGKEYTNIDPMPHDGNMTLSVNGVDVRSVELSGILSTEGTHSIQYRLMGATSNQLILQVRQLRE